MNIGNINRRLDKLGARILAKSRRVVLLVREEGENQADAIGRWCAKHPDETPPDAAVDFIILINLVGPKLQQAPDGNVT
jgi:hypothetical protein